MRRVIEVALSLLEGIKGIAGLVACTLCIAIAAPILVGFTLLLLGLIPYYFWTLVTMPSWLHLYLAVVFIAVVVRLCASDDSSPAPVRRGRVVTSRPSLLGRTRTTTRRTTGRSPAAPGSKIRRGR